MPNKTQEYLNLAQQTAKELTRYWENWTDYLTTASRLYKYSFADQLMIYAQRPDATACASFDIWNNRMNRYVRRGSKGIALLDQSSSVPRLHYVFDVSDTGVRRNSRDPEVWQFNDDLKQLVSEMLSKTYGISGERVSQQLADVAGKLVADYWDNNGGDIRAIVDGSLLMDYDEAGVEMQFKSAAAMSVTYTLLERCGFEPAGWFDKDDFQAIYNFSTPDSVYALGAAVSDMSREVLRQIERTVKTTIRRRNAERSQYEYEQQERDLLDRRGLPAPEPDPAPAGESTGQIRQTAPDLPDEASPGAVQFDAPVGDSASAPVGSGTDGREPDAADHAGTAEAEPGSEQRAASDGVGAAHEQPESTGRGTGDERADLQLSFFDAHIPTEAEQIESIDQTENEKSSSAFSLSQADIENALRRGSNFENSKLRIWKMLKQNIGTHTLLFERLPALITGGTECGSETVNAVSEIKFFYDQMLGQLEFAFCDEVKKLFGEGQDEAILGRKSLPSVVTEWMNRLDPSIHEQLFADGTDRMLQLFLANKEASEHILTLNLAKLATDLNLSDWDANTQATALENVKQYKMTAEKFRQEAPHKEAEAINGYQLTYEDEAGCTVTKRFDKVETSKRGKLLYNAIESAISGMGQAVSEQEKRQILMDVLRELC